MDKNDKIFSSSSLHSLETKCALKTKRSYIPVDTDKRSHLIRLVDKECMTIKDAASQLKINYSTAKHIIKTFKKE